MRGILADCCAMTNCFHFLCRHSTRSLLYSCNPAGGAYAMRTAAPSIGARVLKGTGYKYEKRGMRLVVRLNQTEDSIVSVFTLM